MDVVNFCECFIICGEIEVVLLSGHRLIKKSFSAINKGVCVCVWITVTFNISNISHYWILTIEICYHLVVDKQIATGEFWLSCQKRMKTTEEKEASKSALNKD